MRQGTCGAESSTAGLGPSSRALAHRAQLRRLPARAKLVAARAQAQLKDPFEEKTVYNDSPLDILFIRLFSSKIAAELAPNEPAVPAVPEYSDFVRVSDAIMRGRTTTEQHAVVRKVLFSLMPSFFPAMLRALFPPTRLSAESNAVIAALAFGWLVGESQRKEGEVKLADGSTRVQKSTVLIKKCRYLEASGCVGMCLNLCKVPTQDFFTNDCGLPLTMNPNFEDLSCEMIFGQQPPPLAEDPAYAQPCFTTHCAIATRTSVSVACPKIDTDKSSRPAVIMVPITNSTAPPAPSPPGAVAGEAQLSSPAARGAELTDSVPWLRG